MKKASGIIAIIAGIFGIFAAVTTLMVGGLGKIGGASNASTVVGLGRGGVLFSFLVIVFGAVAMGAETKKPGLLLIACAVIGAILGGTFVAVFMVLALIAGILAVVGTKSSHPTPPAQPYPEPAIGERVWWYASGGNRFGPYAVSELRNLGASGQIAATDLIWKQGLANWLLATSVKGLLPQNLNSVAAPPLPTNNAHSGVSIPMPSLPGLSTDLTEAVPKKKFNRIVKVVIWIFGIFGIFGLLIFSLIFYQALKETNTSSASHSDSTAGVSRDTKETWRKVGEGFRTEKLGIQVKSVEFRTSVGADPFATRASNGGMYIAVLWGYQNISEKPISMFNRPRIHLISPDGSKYDADVGGSIAFDTEHHLDRKIVSDLNPGLVSLDSAVFEVSREKFDASTWHLLVEADFDVPVAFVQATTTNRPPAATSSPAPQPTQAPSVQSQIPPSATALLKEMPTQFRGRWASAEGCKQYKEQGVSGEGVDIFSDQINAYESTCKLNSGTSVSDKEFQGSFVCTNEEGPVSQTIKLMLTDKGLLYNGSDLQPKCN